MERRKSSGKNKRKKGLLLTVLSVLQLSASRLSFDNIGLVI
jgi:hypothetical protein